MCTISILGSPTQWNTKDIQDVIHELTYVQDLLRNPYTAPDKVEITPPSSTTPMKVTIYLKTVEAEPNVYEELLKSKKEDGSPLFPFNN
jgi:hypothetical protein